MRIAKLLPPGADRSRLAIHEGDRLIELEGSPELNEILSVSDPAAEALHRRSSRSWSATDPSVRWLPPIDDHEVWGAGVTYLRSKVARQEESERAASFYDLVYSADRPELFLKATPHRVVGPGAPIRARSDSRWTVPEPELGLVLTPELSLAGFTLGNDVSARDIEGANPLYLPQAKVYDACCALGPSITLAAGLPPGPIAIRLRIDRGGELLFQGATDTSQMARSFAELIGWLGRENRFPAGVVLLTGTGIVPPDDLNLLDGDIVTIEADGIGTLTNPVVRR